MCLEIYDRSSFFHWRGLTFSGFFFRLWYNKEESPELRITGFNFIYCPNFFLFFTPAMLLLRPRKLSFWLIESVLSEIYWVRFIGISSLIIHLSRFSAVEASIKLELEHVKMNSRSKEFMIRLKTILISEVYLIVENSKIFGYSWIFFGFFLSILKIPQ